MDCIQPIAKGLFNSPGYSRHHGRVPVIGHPNQSLYTSSNRHGRVLAVGFSAEGTRNLRNPWVSVQDVVLNSLEPSTLPSQPLPELSHFYTHTSNRNMSAHVAMVLVVVSRLDTKMIRSRQLTSFCQLHKSDHKNTCLHKKSLHQDMVCLFK